MIKRTILLASALVPALALGACANTPRRGLEAVHQPVVSRTDYVFDANTSGNRLAGGEARRLAGWMETLRLRYGDRVAIDDPNRYNGPLRDEVGKMLGHYGLLLSDDAPVTGAPLAPGTVRIVVSRMKASVPGCPDYSRVSQPEYESNTSSNHGCAINANLAAMVANPADLVLGQPGAEVNDPALSTRAIGSYRTAVPSGAGGLKDPGTK